MFLRFIFTLFLVCAAAYPACAGVLLVQGTASTPNAAERNYAAAVNRNLHRWLGELGIEHRVVADEDLFAGVPIDSGVVILGYNPVLPARQREALAAFVAKGGRLLVFYSSDAGLAGLLGFRMGEYRSAPAGMAWETIRRAAEALPDMPEAVRQSSRNIRPVYPVAAEAAVAAVWEGSAVSGPAPPAIVCGRGGAWMTHILLDDGDTVNKQQLLLALVAAYAPEVWRGASERALLAAGQIGSFTSVSHALRAIADQDAGQARPEVQRSLRDAAALYRDLLRQHGGGSYREVVAGSRRLRSLLIDAYASTQSSRQGERRAVWDHSGTGLYPGDWKRTCRVLAGSGITDVFSNVLWPGEAHYDSRHSAASYVKRIYGDQLTQSLAAAHDEGLKLHAWKVCWRLDRMSAEDLGKLRDEGRLQVSDTGQTLSWLCPSHPENRRMEKDAVRDLIRRYPVDGVHLDYIRYPDSHACYCDGCRRRFSTRLGRPVGNWPEGVRSGALLPLYRQWRAEQITAYVRDVSAMVRASRPGIEVSAAVYGRYPLCIASVGQDWGRWIQEGLLDFVCPMNYTADLNSFTKWTREQLAIPGARRRLVVGLGVTAAESRLDPVAVLEQIGVTRAEGVAGFALFDLNRILEGEILPRLRLGATAGGKTE